MSRARYRFRDDCSPNFLTCTVVAWLPVVTRPETMQIILNSSRLLQTAKRGYVDDPTHWRYSSARKYAGQRGILEVTTQLR
jgi:hypothetical protein